MGKSELRHLTSISNQDKHFLDFLHNLIFEWKNTKNIKHFEKKLDKVIRALQG